MPRANRHRLPQYVWHITHRCHRHQFLLKFARDRQACIRWLYQARKRYGLCVLDYAVTSNHIHRGLGFGVASGHSESQEGRSAQLEELRREGAGGVSGGR